VLLLLLLLMKWHTMRPVVMVFKWLASAGAMCHEATQRLNDVAGMTVSLTKWPQVVKGGQVIDKQLLISSCVGQKFMGVFQQSGGMFDVSDSTGLQHFFVLLARLGRALTRLIGS
jgi:hypothetical protein